MARHWRVLCALFMLLAAAFLSPTGLAHADVYPLPTAADGQVSSSVAQAGTCVQFSGSGFKPGAVITITDNGQTIQTINADSNGDFSTPVCFGSDATVGAHRLTGEGLGANGAARIVTAFVTVLGVATQPVGGNGSGDGRGLAFTGFDLVTMMAIGLALVLAGTGLVTRGVRRARRRRADA